MFPVVGVGLDWSQADGWPGPAVGLWSTGVDGVDADIYLQPREARQLVHELQAHLAELEDLGQRAVS